MHDRRHLPALDGLRGLAVLPVLGYHFGFRAFGGGWLGVDLFFVISGFVVTRSMLARNDDDRWSTSEYFWRRGSRLLPVLVVAALVVGFASIFDANRPFPLLDIATMLTMTYNFALELPGIDGDHFRHMWSLAVEWHFYIALPVLLVAVRRLDRRSLIMALAAFAVAVASVRVAAIVAHPRPFFVYTLTPFRVDGLLIGTMLALAPRRWFERVPAWASTACIAALIILLTVPNRWGESILFSMGLLVVVVNFTTAAVITLEDQQRTPLIVGRIVESRTLLWVGERSYSLYVWHFIIGSGFLSPGDETYHGLTILGAQVGLSVVAAATSYALIEVPAQQWLNRHMPARFKPNSANQPLLLPSDVT